ncbi:hypothetical protein DFJ74DRAFT_775102 [Hyaloraphidium curvatum]|nr:hypothetical protein DFJ74DRAFT_775102 [Hyaloraphidium curvatum]
MDAPRRKRRRLEGEQARDPAPEPGTDARSEVAAPTSPEMPPARFSPYRLELYFKTPADLKARVVPFLNAHRVAADAWPVPCEDATGQVPRWRLNVPNKHPSDDLLGALELLLSSVVPPPDVCVHYSMKMHGRGDGAVRELRSFLERIADVADGNKHAPKPSVLLVSGGGDPSKRPKSLVDAARALSSLASLRPDPASRARLPAIWVAYNPHLPDRTGELARLRTKLASGMVAGIALQIGADAGVLRQGLDALDRLVDELGVPTPGVWGSVLVPSRAMLARMRFRPWSGVALPEEYLGSVEGAELLTGKVLRVYAERGVMPIVETAVEDGEGLRRAEAIFRGAAP